MEVKYLKYLLALFPIVFLSIIGSVVVESSEKTDQFDSGLTDNPIKTVASPDGSLWFYGYKSKEVRNINRQGEVNKYPVPYQKQPLNLLVDSKGAAWMYGDNSNVVVKAFGKNGVKSFQTKYSDNPLEVEIGAEYLWLSADNSNKITQINQKTDKLKTFNTPLASNPRDIVLDKKDGVWLLEPGSIIYLNNQGRASNFPLLSSVMSVRPVQGGVWLSFQNSNQLEYIQTPK